MRRTINFISICTLVIIIIAFSISVKAEDNETSKMLNSSFFGNWTKAKKIKRSGKIVLQPWDPYIEYAKIIPDNSLKNVMLQNTNKLNIDYDEIWIGEENMFFTL